MGEKYGGVESQLAVSASDAYSGHPALVRMAIALASSGGASRGDEYGPRLAARALVERLVAAHLTADERSTLEIASLFRQGNVADLEVVGVTNARRTLESISRQVPLVSLETSVHGRHVAFAVHDLVSECLAWSPSASQSLGRRLPSVAYALAEQSKWGRAVSLLRQFGTDVQLLDFVDSTGERMIEEHQAELVLDVLDSVALSRIMSRPKSLLFWSQSLLEVGEVTESIAKAAASIRLAEHEEDFDTLGLAAAQRMQAWLDQCKAQEAIDSSERVRRDFLARMGPAVRGELLLSYGTALGVLERRGEALRAFSEAEAAVSSNPAHSTRLLGRLRRTRAYLHALWDGDFSKGVRETSPLLEELL